MKRFLVGITCLCALAACGGTNKVGNSALLNIKEKTAGGFDVTTTTLPTGTLPPAKVTVAPTTTKAPAVQRTTTTVSAATQNAITAVIKIEGASTSAFNPSLQDVYAGTPVRWENHDTQTRAVVSDDGVTFSSGPIAPGKSFTWTASGATRRIDYHDGTRPYAVAAIVLVPK